MINKTPILFILSLITFNVFSQIGIGTTQPHQSAILDVSSQNKGFLMPRMDYSDITGINNAATGLMVYCNNCCTDGSTVFYDGSVWKSLISSCSDLITIVQPKPDGDFDNDQKPNIDDIDDDNDGIPDIDEQCGTNVSSFGSHNITNHTFQYTVNNASFLIIDINEIDNAFELYINGTNILNGQNVTVHGNTQLQRSMDIQGQDPVIGKQAFKTDMEFINPNDAQYSSNRVYSPWDPRQSGDLPRVRIIINEFGKVSAFATATYNQSHSKYNQGLKPVQLRGYTANGQPGQIVEFNTIVLSPDDNIIQIVSTNEGGAEEMLGTFTSKEHCIDLDNDGLPNYLDLDSDGDGCSDAFEAGATTDPTPNFSFPLTNNGTNGLHNDLETSPDNGIVNYNVINNFNNSTNKNINQCDL